MTLVNISCSKIEETVAELQTPSEVASSTEPGQTKMESNVEEIKPEIKAEPGIGKDEILKDFNNFVDLVLRPARIQKYCFIQKHVLSNCLSQTTVCRNSLATMFLF